MEDAAERSAAEFVRALSAVLSQVAPPSQVLKTILGQAVSQTGADRGLLAMVGPGGRLDYRILYRIQSESLDGEAGSFSRHIFAEIVRTGVAVRLDNAMNDPRFGSKESIQDLRLTSILCMPIKVDGTTCALVHLESNRPGHFTDEHEGLLRTMLEVAAPTLGALQAGEGVLRERDEARRSATLAWRELEESREFLAREWSFNRFVGRSPAVRQLEDAVHKASETQFPVLLLGETGTGKSIIARVLHHGGGRAKGPFVTVFCPSLEKGMVETELFGHKRGAFTGAVADRIGKVQAAEKGTLFLDEVGELPLEIQPKLLRLLQEKTFDRVGDPAERGANVRVIAATNRDLDEEVREGRFRRDLYARLNFVPLRIPPLRERTDDIPLLLAHCLKQHDTGRWVELSDDAVHFLRNLDFAWPGNVRHLEHLAARLAVEQPKDPVGPDEIRRLLDASATVADPEAPKPDIEIGLPALLAHEEKKWLQEALTHHPNLTRAGLAAKLKISEAALYKKLKQYQLGR